MEPNTGFYAKVVADSVNPVGVRLTTLEVCFPRFILAEFNTHRAFSRNSASSRAIPVAKQLSRIKNFPFVPEYFPANAPGMSAHVVLGPDDEGYEDAKKAWLYGRDAAIRAAKKLLDLEIHKQITNRVLEPYMFHTCVVSATDWDNFYNLRTDKNAQPEIQKTALLMQEAMQKSNPEYLEWGEWHLPYVADSELHSAKWTVQELVDISAGRCAAVTLLNQQMKKPEADIARTKRLTENGHMSPLEHPAEANLANDRVGNFDSTWKQYRKFIRGEAVFYPKEEL